MHRSTAHNYGALTASPSVFEENESCGDACARQLPSLEWIKAYDFAWLWNDVAGGITLGLVLLAQSLAHAHLCGVAPIRGPYACLLAPLAYALLGTCHEASIGTGGLVSLVVSEQLAREYATPEERSARAATCALLVGLVLCVMGLLRLAFLVRFLSRPALSGFISGSALLIIKSMSGPMVGGHLPRPNDKHGMHAHGSTALVSFACLAWLFAAKPLANMARGTALERLAESAARFKALVALALASAAVALGLAPGVSVVGEVPQGLPPIKLDVLSTTERVENMLPGAALVAIVVFVSSFASAKKCALHGGYHIDSAKEMWALGAANVAAAACGGVPVQVGLSRSALAISLGVRSQVASLFAAALIAVVLWGAAALVEKVPLCALSAVIAHAAVRLLEWETLGRLWSRRHLGSGRDFCVWLVAFVGTLVLGALWGCAVAVATSLLLVLRTVAAPNLTVLRVERAGGRAGEWRSSPALVSLDEEARSSLVVRVEGPLWYANAERFHEQVEELELFYSRRGEAPLAIVLCASSISFIDATALSVLEEMTASWKRRAVHFYVASAYGQPKALLEAALGDAVGDCSRTIDACLAAENASRTVTTRRRRATSHDLPRAARPDYWASASGDDDAFKVGFHRSLPSFQTLPTSPAGGAAWRDATEPTMPERFDKAARVGVPAKGLRHYLSRLQKARRRGNARKIAKFERKVQKYNNALAAAAPEYAALEAKVLKKLCSLRKKTELQRGATEEEMRMVKKLVETMLSVQSNLQAQAYYAEHTKAIAAGEEWVYPDEHPVVTVGSVEPGEARLILEELGRLGHVVDDDDEYLKALEQAALALADLRAMSVMHTCFREPPFVGISPQGRTLKLALIHANCRSLFHDYNSEQAQRLRKKLLLARLRVCQGFDGTE